MHSTNKIQHSAAYANLCRFSTKDFSVKYYQFILNL
jgi:hypothetical protein